MQNKLNAHVVPPDTARVKGFVQFLPLLLLAVFAVTTFVIVNRVQKERFELRGKAMTINDGAATKPTPIIKSPTKAPTAAPTKPPPGPTETKAPMGSPSAPTPIFVPTPTATVSGMPTLTFSPTPTPSNLTLTPPPSCGDATCTGSENCKTCPADCGMCPTAAPEKTVSPTKIPTRTPTQTPIIAATTPTPVEDSAACYRTCQAQKVSSLCIEECYGTKPTATSTPATGFFTQLPTPTKVVATPTKPPVSSVQPKATSTLTPTPPLVLTNLTPTPTPVVTSCWPGSCNGDIVDCLLTQDIVCPVGYTCVDPGLLSAKTCVTAAPVVPKATPTSLPKPTQTPIPTVPPQVALKWTIKENQCVSSLSGYDSLSACMGALNQRLAVAACGNGKCDTGESAFTCPGDCNVTQEGGTSGVAKTTVQPKVTGPSGPTAGVAVNSCGDGTCSFGETQSTCPADCGTASVISGPSGGKAPGLAMPVPAQQPDDAGKGIVSTVTTKVISGVADAVDTVSSYVNCYSECVGEGGGSTLTCARGCAGLSRTPITTTPIPQTTPFPQTTVTTSGETCSGGVAVGQCASAGSNRWVRCKAGGGRTDGRLYSYPTFETDASCAPTIVLGDIRVQLAMENLASSQQNNLVACENVAVQGYRCSDLASYGQCMSGPGGDTYTCGCDSSGRYRYPTFIKVTNVSQCGRLPTLVQAAITQTQERQQSCGNGCVSGSVIYGVGNCLPLTRGEESSRVCTCDQSTDWQPRFLTREGDACPVAGQGIGSVYTASSGYFCADDGNVYQNRQAPVLVQPCRSIGLICGQRSEGVIQCLGASTVDQLTQAGLGGLASEYECVGTAQFRRRDQADGLTRAETGGLPTTSCPLGTACVAQGDVVLCTPTQTAQQQYMVSLQQASQCSGGGVHGTTRTVSSAVQICRCRISNNAVVPNSCQWEASRPVCSGHFEGESWIDGNTCKSCVVSGSTGQIVSEPLLTGPRDDQRVATGCQEFVVASGGPGNLSYLPNAQVSVDGRYPGQPYCDGNTCRVVTMEPGGSLSSPQTVTTTGSLSAYAGSCPSNCAVYGQDTGIQRSGATLSRCSQDGTSVLFYQSNPRGPASTTPTREEHCASGLCSNGQCVAGVQVFDATTGSVRMCGQGETCRVIDPITGMTLTQQVIARTQDGQTAYEAQTQWAADQAGALQAQTYRYLYEQNAPQYLAQFYSPTYVQAYEQYRDGHSGATVEEFQQVQAEAFERIQPTLENLGVLTQDYLQRVQTGEYIPTEIEATLQEQHQSIGVQLLLTLNNLTSGATYRGNTLFNTSLRQYQELHPDDPVTAFEIAGAPVGALLSSGFRILPNAVSAALGNESAQEELQVQYNLARGTLIQGAAPAAITAAIAGLPALAVISAPVTVVSAVTVGGTAIGVAGTTYSLQQTAEMCAPGRIATSQCAFAAGNSAFAAFSTGVGVIGGTIQLAAQANLARSGVSLAQHADEALGLMTQATIANMSGQAARVASLNRTVAAAGTFLFGGQAVNSCLLGVEMPDGTRRPDPLNCAMNSAMALTSALRFVTASVGMGNTTTTTQRVIETADFGVNSVQALIVCASGGLQRDFTGCTQALAGAVISGGGAYTVGQDFGTGTIRDLDETPTARYERAQRALLDLYTDPTTRGTGTLLDGITPQRLEQAETALRDAILVRSQEQAAVDIAMRRIGGDPLEWTISQSRLNDAQGVYTTVLEAYRVIEDQPVGVRLASPEFAAYQQAVDNLTFVRAAVSAEEAVLTSPRSTIQRITDSLGNIFRAEPEIQAAYRNAQEELRTVARVSDPQSSEYQQALTQLLTAREGLQDYGYTSSQREITQELTPRQEELRRQTQDLRRMEQELLILTNPDNAQRAISEAAVALDSESYRAGDAQTTAVVVELETLIASVAQGREVLGREVAALAAARDQAGTIGGRIRELFGRGVQIDETLNRVQNVPEAGETVVSGRQPTQEEAQSVPLRDRITALVFGTEENPTLLGRLRGTRTQQQESATPQTRLIPETDSFTRQSQERPEFVTRVIDEEFSTYQQAFNEQTKSTPGTMTEGNDIYAYPTESLLLLQSDHIIRDILDAHPTLRILDVGTANGQFLRHVASQYPDRVTVSGLSANDYRSAEVNPLTGFDYTVGNAEHISSLYPKESFDLIVSAVTVRHFADPLGTIEQMYGLLARDGMLVIDYFEVPGLEGRLSDVISYLREQGYTVYASYENDLQYRGPEAQFDTFIIRKTLPELRFPVTYQQDAQMQYGFRYLLSDGVGQYANRETEILNKVLPGENIAFSDYLRERRTGLVSDEEGTLRPLLNEYSRYLLERNSQDRAYLQREFGLTVEDRQNRAFLSDALTQAGGQRPQIFEQVRSALTGLTDRIGNPREWVGTLRDAASTEEIQDNWSRLVNLSLPALIYGRGDIGYQAPEPWFIDVLSSDPHFVSYTPFYRQGISARDLLTVDITRFPQQDREVVETTQNMLRDYLMAPELIDTYESHTAQRRPWLRQTLTELEQSQGAQAATAFSDWYSSNKLSQGELGNVITAVETLAYFSPDYFPAEFTAEVDALHGTYFQVERTDETTGESFTRYDDLPLEGKLEIVEHVNDIARRGLQYLSQFGQ